MFDSLAEKLQAAFAKLRGNAKLSEADVDEALKAVRSALLEADVNFRVVKGFVARVKERAVGENILEGLQPGHQVVKFVHDEMVRTLAGDDVVLDGGPLPSAALTLSPKPPTVVMLCGLQGSGKTTLAGKLGRRLRSEGRQVLLAACDIQRPAAIQQLQVVGKQVEVPVFTIPGADALSVAKSAVEYAKEHRLDIVVLDTAGRLHVDDDLMAELKAIKEECAPSDTLLVLDAMTGQDAVNVATWFDEAIGVGGFVLTKVDGDARGGAAISVRAVVGKPIKFLGVGEKMDALEPFHPDRMAQRILGMGDVLTLIEKAEAAVDEKSAAEMEKKLRQGKFDFEDFLAQMQQMRRLGPFEQLLRMIPGVGAQLKDVDFSEGEKEMTKFEAIVRSMTPRERRHPELINGSRRKRIATGAGVPVQDVNQALNRFEQMRTLMRGLAGGKMPAIPGMGQMPAMPGARPKKKGKGPSGPGRFKPPFVR
ncbi:MAG: signal recognition particle protein [Armatimonadota bacterium]